MDQTIHATKAGTTTASTTISIQTSFAIFKPPNSVVGVLAAVSRCVANPFLNRHAKPRRTGWPALANLLSEEACGYRLRSRPAALALCPVGGASRHGRGGGPPWLSVSEMHWEPMGGY